MSRNGMQTALLAAGMILQSPATLAQSTAAAEPPVAKPATPATKAAPAKPTPATTPAKAVTPATPASPIGDASHAGDATQAKDAGAAQAATPTRPAMDAAPDQAANDANTAAPTGASAKGAGILRAQILLERANFSPGEIDGAAGSNLARAVRGYQAAHALGESGTIDAPTWAALNQDSAPVLVRYTTTAEDVAGPFDAIPTDMMEKSKLPRLGYSSALEGLAEKFHSSPKLLQKLNPGASFDAAGEALTVPNIDGAPIGTVDHVVVDRSDSTVTLVDAGGKALAMFPATTGSEHDPLPVGSWKIQGVAKDPTFNYNPQLFWDANPAHSKAKIPAGPNNPVGVVWIDLSKEHYGIHGTPEPSRIGKSQSHGCIRLTNWSAHLVAGHVKPGMSALLQE